MTLYEKLEVSEKASNEVIEKAYKTLAKKYHPDVQETAEESKIAEDKMKEINEAYSILKDSIKRKEYDNKLQLARQNLNNNNAKRNISGYSSGGQTNTNQNHSQHQTNYQAQTNWQQILANLPPKEREKLLKKIERDAKEQYTRVAEDYYRQQGYRVIHKTTFKEYKARAIAVMIIICIAILLWIIPPSHNWLVSIYEENEVIKIFVNVIINIFRAISGKK